MATQKIAYAAAATMTITMASKTSGQGRRGAAVDNSSNLYIDALVHISILIGTVTAPAAIYMFAYASANDASSYETGGSSDADWNTLRGDEKLIGRPIAATASTTTFSGVGSVAEVFGGRLPRNWGIILSQTNCGTLSGTEGNHTKHYQGVTYTVA